MHPNTTATRRIQVTAEDMERLRELVRGTRRVAGRDRGHLAALDEELDGADVVDTEAVAADVVTMHATGALSLDGLITDISPADRAADAYRAAFDDPSCLKMVLDWSALS